MSYIEIYNPWGFFSGCSVRLFRIIEFFNNNNKLPDVINCRRCFLRYNSTQNDITFDFFKDYNKIINVNNFECIIPIDDMCFSLSCYKSIPYQNINIYLKKYFEPSENIIEISNYFITKYNINPYFCIGIYYRGTDKWMETRIDSYENFYKKLNEILLIEGNKNIQILIQTDTTQFLEYMQNKCQDKNIIIINEIKTSTTSNGVHNENTNEENYFDAKKLLSIVLILSKCKYIICTSGNVSSWIMFNRGNASNVYQNLNLEWV
uniref:Uncharacterized protein n=1 Tax=viral metagenome TaxID=1070528 RepID=A0A6C0GZP0_9ZZZZ